MSTRDRIVLLLALALLALGVGYLGLLAIGRFAPL